MKSKRIYKITCEVCGKEAEKYSAKAKYCSKSCNQRAYELRKGIKKPAFLAKKSIGQQSTATTLPYQMQNQIQDVIGPQSIEKGNLIRKKNNLLREFSRIANDQDIKSPEGKLFGAVVGLGLGIHVSKIDDNNIDMLFKLLGIPFLFSMAGGNIFAPKYNKDAPTKMKRLDSIKAEIESIDMRLNQIRIASMQAIQIKEQFKQPDKPIYKGSEYKYQKLETLDFKKMWLYLVGKPAPNFFMLMTGSPGNGKTTCAVKFADYFHRNHGKTLYIPAEQGGLNVAFQDLLKRYNTDFDIFVDTKNLEKEEIIKLSSKYGLIVFDSINYMKLSHEDIEEIRAKAPRTAFVGILQATKEGKYKGSQEYEHNCDIFIKLENMIAYQTKSRYASKAHHPID